MTATTAAAERRYRISEHYLNGPEGPMRYWASEPRQGLPVLFIHGYGALIDHWRSIMRAVAREHTFYALDLYGFGYSARPAGPPTKQRWADQIAAFINQVIGGPTVVVGHSMGGAVTSEVARRHGDLARAIVLVNSSGMQLHERVISANDRLLLDLIGAPLVGELAAGIFANEWGVRRSLLGSYYRKDRVTPELVRSFSGPIRRYGAGSYLAVTRNSLQLVVELQPGEYRGPALVIWGEEDRSIPPSDADKLKRLVLPQAEVQLLPESGHCCFDETPEAFCEILLPWLSRQEQAAPHNVEI
ncbi:MAG: alpha/beta fold hydrolase [Oscillochloris sp.]|nr:alpha/beta fold hydrolase [Oscillochloris sp.]